MEYGMFTALGLCARGLDVTMCRHRWMWWWS
jgi:hypothetical protein